MQQVITVTPRGSVEGLNLEGGLDLRRLGRASVQRVSEILWDDSGQAWKVVPLTGTLAGSALSYFKLAEAGVPADVLSELLTGVRLFRISGPLLFQDYGRASRFEVDFLQWCALHGRAGLVTDTVS